MFARGGTRSVGRAVDRGRAGSDIAMDGITFSLRRAKIVDLNETEVQALIDVKKRPHNR